MRVLNGATLRCLEPVDGVVSCDDGDSSTATARSARAVTKPAKGDLRVMHGSAGKSSLFIFRRV
jgi:hypothetical protein